MNNTTFVCLVFRRLPFSFSFVSAFMYGVPDPFLCISILRYLSSLPWLFQPACTLSCYYLYIVISYNKLLLMVLY